ncbi:MAG: 3-oxoacyl-ACP synthase III [Myxococcota bacterium]|nr:3-oxoacyl-ACP synthase III [Myxococcota bacterium]
MVFENVSIASIAHVDAPIRITSSEVEEQLAPTMDRLKIRPGLLESLSGIKARRLWEAGTQPSQAATKAAKLALEHGDVSPGQVGFLINTSVCRDYLEPSTACLVHGNLKLPATCMNYDIGNACLGFMNGMDIAAQMLENAMIDYALVVDGESSRFPLEQTIERLLDPECSEHDFRSQFATLTLGSGSVAMLLTRRNLRPKAPRYIGGVTRAATQYNRICLGQPDKMLTDTKELLVRGIELASQTFVQARAVLGWSSNVLDELVLHQVSKAHTEKLADFLRLDLNKAVCIYPEYGNIGPASVPIVLSKAIEAGRVGPGARVGLLGIGSGLNCSMAEIRF